MRLEVVLAGLGLAAFAWLKKKAEESEQERTEERGTYRPGSSTGDGVRFNDVSGDGDSGGPERDAFTGEDLDPSRAVYQCQGCRSWYHGDTLRTILHENQGQCVACKGVDIVRDRITEDRLREQA